MRNPRKIIAVTQRGFTLVELITIIIILGIISVVALPRFTSKSSFDSRAFSDEVKSTLRLAQKLAVAQHRNSCVNVTAANVAIKVSSAEPGACDTALPSLSGSGNYLINAPGSSVLTFSAATITFDLKGSPGATAITLKVDTEPTITVEAETGYVH